MQSIRRTITIGKDVELAMLNASRSSSREVWDSKKLTWDKFRYLAILSHLELSHAIAQDSRQSSLPIVTGRVENIVRVEGLGFGAW